MRTLKIAVFVLLATLAVGACDFQYDPASIPQYYRAEGWTLPGTTDFNRAALPQSYGAPMLRPIPGAQAELLPHGQSPYVVEFPAQEFVLNGVRKKMRPMLVKATVVRWKIHGRVVAYSYDLIPVQARQSNGKWVVESEAACVFTATFIDDRGDAVFRTLVPGAFTADLVPRWARPKKKT